MSDIANELPADLAAGLAAGPSPTTGADTIPAPIAAALIRVARSVEKIAKDAKNQHGNYKYASVDAYYQAIGPLMAEAGIIIRPREMSRRVELMGDKHSVVMVYRFQIIHESGITWQDFEEVREVRMHWQGPQTFGALQSYAHKQYTRGLWSVPTGDPEADAESQREYADNQAVTEKRRTAKAAAPAAIVPKTYQFEVGGAVKALAPEEVLDVLEPALDDMFPADRAAWERRNDKVLRELQTDRKADWLRVRRVLDAGRQGGARP
jgi:hypothetical protein